MTERETPVLTTEEQLRHTIAIQEDRIKHLTEALSKQQEQNEALTVRCDVVEEMRSTLYTQLTNANILRKREATAANNQLRATVQKEQEQSNIRVASCHQRIVALETELAETRTTFGKVKHAQKEDQRNRVSAQDALDWFKQVCFAFNGNVQKELGRFLTQEDIQDAMRLHPIVPEKLTRKTLLGLFN